jgi:hypothetical protein
MGFRHFLTRAMQPAIDRNDAPWPWGPAGLDQRLRRGARILGTAATVVVAALALAGGPARAESPPPTDDDCMSCHAPPVKDVTLDNGEKLPVAIDAKHFASSSHGKAGCISCHKDVDLDTHPPDDNGIASKRAYAVAMAKNCETCHKKQADQWAHSVHASLVRDGKTDAPVCTDCHAPHAMTKAAAQSMDTVPCRSCHTRIFTAYSTSVHGLLRAKGEGDAPLCFDCHNAHDVAVASAGVGRKDACLDCHTEAVASHSKWLPNVDLHFTAVSCPACHTPKAQRVVNLILYDSTTQQEVSEPTGIPEFASLPGDAATKTAGLDSTTLMTVLTGLNSQRVGGKTAVRGRLEVRTGIEDHQLTDAKQAISECSTCHKQGAAAFQSVEVSVAGPSGLPIRYDANQTVLSSPVSIESVGGFYAIGGTRITLLDVLLGLAFVGGVGGPAAHGFARWGFKRFMNGTPQPPRKG